MHRKKLDQLSIIVYKYNDILVLDEAKLHSKLCGWDRNKNGGGIWFTLCKENQRILTLSLRKEKKSWLGPEEILIWDASLS